jgi:hypothetical protein
MQSWIVDLPRRTRYQGDADRAGSVRHGFHERVLDEDTAPIAEYYDARQQLATTLTPEMFGEATDVLRRRREVDPSLANIEQRARLPPWVINCRGDLTGRAAALPPKAAAIVADRRVRSGPQADIA